MPLSVALSSWMPLTVLICAIWVVICALSIGLSGSWLLICATSSLRNRSCEAWGSEALLLLTAVVLPTVVPRLLRSRADVSMVQRPFTAPSGAF
ncbi:hypothetical protein Y695_04017 [Hydrogenophaga sp. T4]|nr:hypothetical protein Y695_04017 [Hydrogenophaga sp. T4]